MSKVTALVERLRARADGFANTSESVDYAERMLLFAEAAAEIERLTQERDDAEARGEAMFEKLQPALTIAEAEIERLQTALREAHDEYESGRAYAAQRILRAALSGKGEPSEANLCTCGAAGSGEEHEEWCEAAALSGKGE